MITLTHQKQGGATRVFRFQGSDAIGIGRAAGNALQIQDARVSSLHGQVIRRGQGWCYSDLRSTNGSLILRGETRTVVDGEETVEAALADGDLLLLGDVDDPVVLQIAIGPAAEERLAGEGTIVARRAMDRAVDLSGLLFGSPEVADDPLLALLARIGGETEVSAVFESVARFLLDRLASANTVVLAFSDEREPGLIVGRDGDSAREVDADPPPYPRGIVQKVLADSEAVLITDEAAALDADRSLARFGASAALAVPLGSRRPSATPDGVLVVTGGAPGFRPHDLDLAVALAYQVGSCFATAGLIKRLRGVERRLRDENRYLRKQIERDGTFSDIIGASAAIQDVFEKMRLVMDTTATVLITGETGTGKELVARALHTKSRRRNRLFAAVNCAALSENLLESELFGHVKGAFTGAHENKHGLFKVADGGTLFLDEIGELSGRLQAKLLRVLQEGEVQPVGSTRPIQIDVRIVCATHKDLRKLAREGGFREDLFYRINVFPIHLPALRERGDDVLALAQFFLDRYAKQFRKDIPGLTESARGRLRSHPFPGNIRELENEMQRSVLLTPNGSPIDAQVMSDELRGAAVPSASTARLELTRTGSLKETMERLEREVLRVALEEQGWNRSATARELSISRQALMVKLSKYRLAPE